LGLGGGGGSPGERKAGRGGGDKLLGGRVFILIFKFIEK